MQVSANGFHIDSITDAMADLSDLTLDVMTYRVIKRLITLKQRWAGLLARHIACISSQNRQESQVLWTDLHAHPGAVTCLCASLANVWVS